MKDFFTGYPVACCDCGETPDEKTVQICNNCGGYCCSDSCLVNHECDEEGDLDE